MKTLFLAAIFTVVYIVMVAVHAPPPAYANSNSFHDLLERAYSRHSAVQFLVNNAWLPNDVGEIGELGDDFVCVTGSWGYSFCIRLSQIDAVKLVGGVSPQ
jgi:hypothetical protein